METRRASTWRFQARAACRGHSNAPSKKKKTAKEFERLDVFFLEEPLPRFDFDRLAELNRLTTVNLAGGEEQNAGVHEFRWLLEKGCFDIIRSPKINRDLLLQKVAVIAESMKKPIMPHRRWPPEHRVRHAPRRVVGERSAPRVRQRRPRGRLRTQLRRFRKPIASTRDGCFETPQAPGLGVTIRQAVGREERRLSRSAKRDRRAGLDGRMTLPTVAVLGGTGQQGRGIALRLARAGHRVIVGSRDPVRAAALVSTWPPTTGRITADGYAGAAAAARTAVLAVPFDAVDSLLDDLRGSLQPGTPVVDVTAPMTLARRARGCSRSRKARRRNTSTPLPAEVRRPRPVSRRCRPIFCAGLIGRSTATNSSAAISGRRAGAGERAVALLRASPGRVGPLSRARSIRASHRARDRRSTAAQDSTKGAIPGVGPLRFRSNSRCTRWQTIPARTCRSR